MVFSSLFFLFVFLPTILAVYYISPKKYKNLVLFIGSLIFYAWGEPVYIVLMIFSTVVDYTHGMLVHKHRDNKSKARLFVISSVVINLTLLGFFKYANFLVDTLNVLEFINLPLLNLSLPIGISFYTFQTMSYTIDVYRNDAPVQKNIISFGAYVSLFPQLIAGPIVRYKSIAHQLNERRVDMAKFSDGVTIFVIGLTKKVFLANNIGFLWDTIKATPQMQLSAASAWLGIIAWSFQIYFDFSGYSDMAIGLGKLFGFDLPMNFNYPFISKSITEFWRRWHMSLGIWFREYVYIPLGGNRGGKYKVLLNIMMVWFLTGLWHGASWNFISWGLYFGIMLLIEKHFLHALLKRVPVAFHHFYVLFVFLIGGVIFNFEKAAEGISYLRIMFGMGSAGIIDSSFIYDIYTHGILLIILAVASTPILNQYIEKNKGKVLYHVFSPVTCLVLLLICTAYLVDSSYNPFLYFRF